MLSGWLAFRLELEEPGTAMLTCAIVLNPKSGLVLAKSFYRILGTLAGSLVALCLVGLFPQERAFLLGGVALWLGLCAGGATLLRNFKSYGFVLAGYTAAIVITPVVDNPQDIFHSVVMRTLMVLLGILVTAVISDVIIPQGLGRDLKITLSKQFQEFLILIQNCCPNNNTKQSDVEQIYASFSFQAVEAETLLSSALFEDTDIRRFKNHIRQLNQRFMIASFAYCELLAFMKRLQQQSINSYQLLADFFIQTSKDLVKLSTLPIDHLLFSLQSLRRQLEIQTDELKKGFDQHSYQSIEFNTGSQLIINFLKEFEVYVNTYAVVINLSKLPEHSNTKETIFSHSHDWLGAILATFLSAGVILVDGLFWILTEWPSGGDMVVMAGVLSALMISSASNLKKKLNILWIAWFIGSALALLCLFLVLPYMDGFILLTMGMLPFLILIFYLYTRPLFASLGAFVALSFFLLLESAFTQHYDIPQYINQAIALLFSIWLVNIAFILFTHASESHFFYKRLVYKIRDEIDQACDKPLNNARNHLESILRDCYQQVTIYLGKDALVTQYILAWALSVHEVGHIMIKLRTEQKRTPEHLQRRLTSIMIAITTLYKVPKYRNLLHAQQVVARILHSADKDNTSNITQQLYLLHLILMDQQSVFMNMKKQSNFV
ncbi:p-hydroxybenzoic acid efflux pump subunit AaeB [Candidatus Nitrosacidococcus sp. I8]|nr:p-hydroxybenzoic acid efflux pump subunit AaeB [Candidatus Nitrosacidococcus sp. I8]